MQGFRTRSRSAKSKREGPEAMLIESVFQDNKPECLTHAKQLAEASKVFLFSCNFESPAHAPALVDESEKWAMHTPSLHTVFWADILAWVYELEPEKSTRCVAVFLVSKEPAKQSWKCILISNANFESPAHGSAFLDGELQATPLVDELADILALVYELEPEKLKRCVAVFLARKEPSKQSWKCILIISANFESPAHGSAFLGGELGATPLVDELDELADILALVYELEPEKSTRCVAVFLARKEPAKQSWKCILIISANFESPAHGSAFLGRELGATPLVDELDESEKSAVRTPPLHTVSCANILALVYELEPEKSALCVAVFLARKDCALALLGGELEATLLEEFEQSEKPALQTQIEIVLQNDRTDRWMAWICGPHDCGVDGFFVVALSWENKVLVLDDPEYVHYNAENVDLTSSQDKRFMLLKKTSVSNSANQHKCPARPQGREIFWSSCNALPIVTEDDAVTESSRILWLPIKHGARVSQKDKLGLTFIFIILLLGWIPGVNAVDENAFLRGTISTCTWFWIIIITIASAYCAYKILRRSPPEPYLFSEKVRIWINGEMNVEVYDAEGILVGSWRCALSTANGEWVTHLLNCVLHIFVQQKDGRVKEISFIQMDDPEFIGMPMDVYLHNPDTGLLQYYIGRSVPQNGAPSERDILRVGTIFM